MTDSTDIDREAARVLERACALEFKLATAESCTGGLLASVLTDVEGCSHAFERGFVVYTDEAKHELLGVPLDLIEAESAVSEPVARRMAEGGLARSNAHLCVAVTGYADDAGGKAPAGLVHFAVAQRGAPTGHRKEEFGDLGRTAVREACVRTALAMIDETLAR